MYTLGERPYKHIIDTQVVEHVLNKSTRLQKLPETSEELSYFNRFSMNAFHLQIASDAVVLVGEMQAAHFHNTQSTPVQDDRD